MGKFKAMMPRKFDEQFTDIRMIELFTDELAIGIKDVTDEQLAYGVNQVRLTCAWPPSVSEFVKFCAQKDEGHIFNEFKKLPVLRGSKENASPYRKKLKKMLGY